MKKSYNGEYTMVIAEKNKYLTEKGSKNKTKMVKAIYMGEEIPEFEEKELTSEK